MILVVTKVMILIVTKVMAQSVTKVAKFYRPKIAASGLFILH